MALIFVLLLLALIAGGVHVAATLGIMGYLLGEMYSFFPMHRALGEIAWSSSTDFLLVAVPMFILMGEILLRSGVADDMYVALSKWVSGIPGGLMHTNIAACAFFAASSGSSVATAATISVVSIPNMQRYSYNPGLFLSSIAAGGTLGILIPPSINMVLYGALSETSVGTLYLAAIVPGIVLAVLFSLTILVLCVVRPAWSGRHDAASWRERLSGLVHLLPPVLLFLVVVGAIYVGVATPTEAAALGVVATILLAAQRRRLSLTMLVAAFDGTMRTTAMVLMIVIAAFFLNFVLSSIGLIDGIIRLVEGLAWEPIWVLLAIIGIYLGLGCVMDTLTLMIATTPLVVPVIIALGYDPVWFGVVFMILIELALITPPIGVNLFVVQSVRGSGPSRDLLIGILPFVATMLAMIGLLIAWPQLAMWLPGTVGQ